METWPYSDTDDEEFEIGCVESLCGRHLFPLILRGTARDEFRFMDTIQLTSERKAYL